MAQTGFTPIQIYYSTTTTNAPSAGNLTDGELAINTADGKLFYKDNGGVVQVIAWKTTPTTAGGTGLTSWTAGDLPYYSTGTTLTKLGIGTNGQILTSTGTAPQWSTLSGVAVTTFSAGTTGLTPSTPTSGAITLAGTLATTNGGTGLTSFTANRVFYSSSTSAIGSSANLTFDGTTLTANALTTTSTVTVNGGTANGVAYLNGSKVLTTGSALVFDGSNLGLGVTPSAWGASKFAFQLGARASLYGANNLTVLGNNYYADAADNRYIATAAASDYYQSAGSHVWRTAASGTAGNIISFTQAMTLNASGQLIVGGTGAGNAIVTSNGGVSFEARDATQPFYQWYNSGAGTDLKYWRTGPNTSGDLQWQTVNDAYNSASNLMILSRSGNLGLGVTPSAWRTGFSTRAIQVGPVGSLASLQASTTNNQTYLASNAYLGTTDWIYLYSDAATYYRQFAGQHHWFTAPSGTAGNAISFTQAMTLDASGNFYVGTTSQSGGSNITFNQPANADMKIAASVSTGTRAAYQVFVNSTVTTVGTENSTGGSLATGTAAYATVLANSGAYPICFATNNNERARITSDGDLLVGTTTAVAKVTVTNGSATQYLGSWRSDRASVQYFHTFNYNGTEVGSITGNNTNTAYNTSSDYRLKNITGPITNSGAYIDSLKPVEGTWKADGSTFVGLIAHEVQEVSRTNIATGTKDGEQMQGMDYSASEIIANLIAEVQSLRARVKALEAK